MANTTENASRALTMKDFFKEENGEIIPLDESVLIDFKDGDIVEGDVVRIDKDEVLVDIGYKSEGLIPSNELSIRKGADPHDIVELGQHIEALVLQKEDADGRLILSAKRAAFEKAWNRIEEAHTDQRTVEGPVIEVVKGGLIIDIGLRGFLPASLVDIRRVRNLDSFMSQRLECKVIELNRSRNNVVLSRRAVLEEERKEERNRILTTLQEGEKIKGTISNLVDFGAFVDLDGIDGLIHISELSWNHVDHPSEVVEVGEEVEVKVLEVDRDRERISLGLKQTRKDPWQEIVERVSVGEQIQGRVTKLVSFGAFVEVAEGVEGLIHISELAEHHVETPDEIVRSGDEVDARIIDVDAKRRRLSLSLRPKKEEREEQSDQDDGVNEVEQYDSGGEDSGAEQRTERAERPRREDRFRRDYEQPRGSRGGDRDRGDRGDRDRGGRDRDRGDKVGDGLRTGAFDALKDLDLETRE